MSLTFNFEDLLKALLSAHSVAILVDGEGKIISSYSRIGGLGLDLSKIPESATIEEFLYNPIRQEADSKLEERWKTLLSFPTLSTDLFYALMDFMPKEYLYQIEETQNRFLIRYAPVSSADKIEFLWIVLEKAKDELGPDPQYEKFMLLKKIPPEALHQCRLDINQSLEDASEAIFNKDAGLLKSVLHGLKGSFRPLEVASLTEQIHALEDQVSAKSNWLDIKQGIDRTRKDWGNFESLIAIFTVPHDQVENLKKDNERKDLIASFVTLKNNLGDWWALTESKEFREFEKKLKLFLLEPLQGIESLLRQDIRLIANRMGKGARIILKIDDDIRFKKEDIKDLKALIMHLMTNAIVHGIEDPEERMNKNLNPEGTIRLIAKKTQNFITLIVEDDGPGIKKDKLVKKLIERNLVDSEVNANKMSLND